jgi:hypothetical protein
MSGQASTGGQAAESALHTPQPARSRSSDVTRPVTPADRAAAAALSGGTGPSKPADAASTDSTVARKAAHRLPTGAYPVVATDSASMRPRNEPPPEPADLFRPPQRSEQQTEGPHPLAPDTAVAVGSARNPGNASGLGANPSLKKAEGRSG